MWISNCTENISYVYEFKEKKKKKSIIISL